MCVNTYICIEQIQMATSAFKEIGKATTTVAIYEEIWMGANLFKR